MLAALMGWILQLLWFDDLAIWAYRIMFLLVLWLGWVLLEPEGGGSSRASQ